MDLLRGEIEMLDLDLRLRPGKFKGPLYAAHLLVMVGFREHLFPRLATGGRKAYEHRITSRNRHRTTQGKSRVDDRADMGRQMKLLTADGRLQRSTTSNEGFSAAIVLYVVGECRCAEIV